ncbi:hypothetical protein CBP31_13635 [Oceanisphaera profunda]|uniref:DUF2989 domain-containing protein n=1 Tax=Oceanisphaera profunda TaxID=1416627 RepID=A0A1Y0D7L9_9GAMM|nr:DUF2989 domain-containing protein [Oceanisphaera profunda]ART83540.1 hypothetical protein CBP31_13635 [Oceanisphaera profunda]
MKIKQSILLLAVPFFLAACDRDRIPNICADTPQFCVDLHADSWCKFERTALIRARKQQATLPSAMHDYDLLNKLQTYHNCLDPLLAIEYTRHKERKNDKVEAVYHAKEAINQLAIDTQGSDHPQLLLWHWQHKGSQQAKARFIKLADRAEMQDPELQNALAELLLLRDSDAAEQALHKALSLYHKGDALNPDIIANLLTLYIRQQRYQEAWIWTQVLSKLDYQENIELSRLNTYAQFSVDQQQQLQQDVERILEQLAKGTYSAPSHITKLKV